MHFSKSYICILLTFDTMHCVRVSQSDQKIIDFKELYNSNKGHHMNSNFYVSKLKFVPYDSITPVGKHMTYKDQG